MATTSKPRRRWFQYSVRTLLVLMLLACIGMGWLAMKMQQARRQRAAVEAIVRLGGVVAEWSQRFAPLSQGSAVSSQDSAVPTFWVGMSPSYAKESRTHAWLRKLLGDDFFSYPVAVAIRTDAAMENLEWLPRLKSVNVNGGQITDAGLKYLKGLTQLQHLGLSRTQVTDAGLERLKGLTQLRTLNLSCTPVTDVGLEHLNGMTQLRFLHLSYTQVTGTGLEHLIGLPRLRTLTLAGTQVTDAGLEHGTGRRSNHWLALKV